MFVYRADIWLLRVYAKIDSVINKLFGIASRRTAYSCLWFGGGMIGAYIAACIVQPNFATPLVMVCWPFNFYVDYRRVKKLDEALSRSTDVLPIEVILGATPRVWNSIFSLIMLLMLPTGLLLGEPRTILLSLMTLPLGAADYFILLNSPKKKSLARRAVENLAERARLPELQPVPVGA